MATPGDSLHALCMLTLPSLPPGSGTVCAGGPGFGHSSCPAAGHTLVPAAQASPQKHSEKASRQTGRVGRSAGKEGRMGGDPCFPAGSELLAG